MKYKLATTCFVIGAMLAPFAAYAEDADADRPNPATFVKDSAITTKIKSQLATKHLGSLKHTGVDTDRSGVVWMMRGPVLNGGCYACRTRDGDWNRRLRAAFRRARCRLARHTED